MLCQRCKKNQATMISQVPLNGEKVGYALCTSCYAEMFGSINSANGDIMAGLLSQPQRKRPRACPVCGMSYSEFERTGLLGCAACYDVFKDELMPYIRRIQGKTEHVGKVGPNVGEQELTRTLSRLQEELEQAVRDGKYAVAARINDKISEVRGRMAGGEGKK